jgi:hypothetical protein
MANGFIVVDENDWHDATPEQQSWMTYKTLKSISDRLQALEKRPLTDKCFSFAGGLIGGALAAFGIKWGA